MKAHDAIREALASGQLEFDDADGFAANFTTEELKEHYRALIDEECNDMTREQLIEALRDTEFEEHAYN
jgi:hypothetical protein